jgi:2-amino-4-hydroxy-6-hydroxymethyldihydropteridine diphosphokinase
MEQHTVYLALGTNLGNRFANLKEAVSALPPQMEVKAKSEVYETLPWGFKEQEQFLNQVLRVETYLQPEPLLRHLKRLEIALGRKESFPNGPRQIDLDILFYDDLVLYSPALMIPHPYVHERGFVLVPLMDIAPDFVHPVRQKTIRELVSIADVSGIRKYERESNGNR